MKDAAPGWHYGLMAERYAEFYSEFAEAPYYLRLIRRFGQPVLDVACGSGRVMLPLLQAGIDVDGCDISADMLETCRRRAQQAGFYPNLDCRPMHAFALPRTYATVLLCNSFGLAGDRQRDLETLRACHAHLAPGGALLVNISAAYNSPDTWNLWLPATRRALPEPWPDRGEGRTAADGSVHYGVFRYASVDPLEQAFTRQARLEKWVGETLVAAEEISLRFNMYLPPEVRQMLLLAGFRHVEVQGDFTEAPATAESRELIFIATR